MRTPAVYTPKGIKNWTVEEEHEPDEWRPARPCAYCIEFMVRVRIAWRVFIGRYDALNWGEKSGELNNQQVAYRDHLTPRK